MVRWLNLLFCFDLVQCMVGVKLNQVQQWEEEEKDETKETHNKKRAPCKDSVKWGARLNTQIDTTALLTCAGQKKSSSSSTDGKSSSLVFSKRQSNIQYISFKWYWAFSWLPWPRGGGGQEEGAQSAFGQIWGKGWEDKCVAKEWVLQCRGMHFFQPCVR